jgi:hypothetical protein
VGSTVKCGATHHDNALIYGFNLCISKGGMLQTKID